MGLLSGEPQEQSKSLIHCRGILENLGHVAVEQNHIGSLGIDSMVLAADSFGKIIFGPHFFGGVRYLLIHIGVFRAELLPWH